MAIPNPFATLITNLIMKNPVLRKTLELTAQSMMPVKGVHKTGMEKGARRLGQILGGHKAEQLSTGLNWSNPLDQSLMFRAQKGAYKVGPSSRTAKAYRGNRSATIGQTDLMPFKSLLVRAMGGKGKANLTRRQFLELHAKDARRKLARQFRLDKWTNIVIPQGSTHKVLSKRIGGYYKDGSPWHEWDVVEMTKAQRQKKAILLGIEEIVETRAESADILGEKMMELFRTTTRKFRARGKRAMTPLDRVAMRSETVRQGAERGPEGLVTRWARAAEEAAMGELGVTEDKLFSGTQFNFDKNWTSLFMKAGLIDEGTPVQNLSRAAQRTLMQYLKSQGPAQ